MALSLGFSLFLVVTAAPAHAAIIAEQLDASTAGGGSFTVYRQYIGATSCSALDPGYAGEIDQITFNFAQNTGSGTGEFKVVLQTNGGSTLTSYESDPLSFSNSTSPQNRTFNFSTPVNLIDDCEDGSGVFFNVYAWRMAVERVGSGSLPIAYGSGDPNSFLDGECNGGTCSSTVEDAYFIIEATPPDFSTRIIAQNSPANGSTTATTNVNFNFTYYWNDTEEPSIDTVGVLITNMVTGATAFIEETPTPGENTFSENITLMEDSQYYWQPFLESSTSGLFIQRGSAQPANQFFVVSNPYEGTGINTGVLATSSATSSNAFAAFYQGLNNTIRNNPPFKSVFDTLDLFRELSTTTAAVSLSLPAGIEDNITDPLKAGMAWLLVIAFGIFVLVRLVTFTW